MKRKICIVTGTRAEYGLLAPLMKKIKEDKELELQIIATGMHISPEFGFTYKQIEKDGFLIDEKVEILLSSDTHIGVVKSIGLANIGFADAFSRLKADAVIILGDRFEMLAAAQSALILQIPIIHIHGGECTFGAYDDAIRHAITKMATWHFTSSEKHCKRVIQLGEHPERVWNVGAIGIENIKQLQLISKEMLFEDLGLELSKDIFLITYHPETNGDTSGIHSLLASLKFFEGYQFVFTKSNADNGGRYINKQIESFVQQFEHAYLFESLGQIRYLSTANYAKVVIGNSSSALIEVPYLETPSVNIGNRQKGREKPNSVFDAESKIEQITDTIHQALQFNGPYEQIFGDGSSSTKILSILKEIPNFRVEKGFYDL